MIHCDQRESVKTQQQLSAVPCRRYVVHPVSLCHLCCHGHHVLQQRQVCARQRAHVPDVLLGNHQVVVRTGRRDIAEAQHLLILIENGGRQLAAQDTAEDGAVVRAPGRSLSGVSLRVR